MKQVQERQRELVERKAAAAREKENTLALVQSQAQALVTQAQEEASQRLKKPKFAVLTSMPINIIGNYTNIREFSTYSLFQTSCNIFITNVFCPATPGRQAHQGMRDIVVSTSHQKPSRAIVAVSRVNVAVPRKVATTGIFIVAGWWLFCSYAWTFFILEMCVLSIVLSRVHIRLSRVATVVIEESDSQANDSESQLSAFEDDFTHSDDEESDGSDDDDNENHENQMVQEMYASAS